MDTNQSVLDLPDATTVVICGTVDRPGTPEEMAAAEAMAAAMMPAMQRAAEMAAMELVQRSKGNTASHAAVENNYKLTEAAVRKIADDVRGLVTKLARRGVASGGTLPYQDLLSDELKKSIDDGALDMIGYCNSHHGEMLVPSACIDEGTVEACQIAINGFLPLQLRKLKGRITNTTIYEVRGEDARYMGLSTLWDAISPPRLDKAATGLSDGTTSRFSLPTAIMTLRLSAMKFVPTLEDYFYYDHPSNCLLTTTEGSTNKSGVAFTALKKLAETFNAMIYRHHGSPEEGTAHWKAANDQFFQPATVKEVIAALSRITKVDNDKATRQARLFFTAAPTPQWRSNPELVALIQPIISIDSPEVEAERQLLYDRLVSGTLTRGIDQADMPILSDPPHAPPAPAAHKINDPTLNLLGHPASFKWEKPGDARPDRAKPRSRTEGANHWRGESAPLRNREDRKKKVAKSAARSSHVWRYTR